FLPWTGAGWLSHQVANTQSGMLCFFAAFGPLFLWVLPEKWNTGGMRTRINRVIFDILCVQQHKFNALIFNIIDLFC
ncbi:hypothetical protein POW39_09365, partial [Escherichia coli]